MYPWRSRWDNQPPLGKVEDMDTTRTVALFVTGRFPTTNDDVADMLHNVLRVTSQFGKNGPNEVVSVRATVPYNTSDMTVNERVVFEINELVRRSGSPIAANLRLVENGEISDKVSEEWYVVIRGDLDMHGRAHVVLKHVVGSNARYEIWEPFDMVAIDPGRAHDFIGACTAPHVFGCPDEAH